jgi:hypothetical protein
MRAYETQFPVIDARFGFRLSDPRIMKYEVYWPVRPWE